MLLHSQHVGLLLAQPETVQLEKTLLDALLAQLLVLELALEHHLVTGGRGPQEPLVHLELSATAGALAFEGVAQAAAFEALEDVLEVVDLLEVVRKVAELPVLLRVFE